MSLVYLDGIITFYKDNESHLDHLGNVFSILEEGGVKLNHEKCFSSVTK